MPHRVFVVENDDRIVDIFQRRPEFRITRFLGQANVVVWPGGPDVSPEYYGHKKHPATGCDPERDERFKLVHKLVSGAKILKIGICGGGQFLHVMNGGVMYQDVDQHCRLHPMHYSPYNTTNKESPKSLVVSTHHQQMKYNPMAERWGVAYESTYRDLEEPTRKARQPHDPDNEVLFYPLSNTLCFQPHPEYGHKDTEDVFFKAVSTCIARGRVSSHVRTK